MQNTKDYYRLLHVQSDAPLAVIRSSYRALMQKSGQHPDRGGDHEQAALINEAYAVLSDPQKRAEYDLRLRQPNIDSASAADESRYREASADRCLFCGTPHLAGAIHQRSGNCSACASPLFVAPKLQLPQGCRRGAQRLAHGGDIAFYTRWPQEVAHHGQIRNLSPNGMQFQTRVALEKDRVIKIDGDAMSSVARVVNQSRQWGLTRVYWVGVEFCTIRFVSPKGTFFSAVV